MVRRYATARALGRSRGVILVGPRQSGGRVHAGALPWADLHTLPQLLTHPRAGASWEGFALEQVLRIARVQQAFFWATHQGAELDLLMLQGSQCIGVEFKRADLAERMEAVPLWALLPAGQARVPLEGLRGTIGSR